jgi:hypothetical protein
MFEGPSSPFRGLRGASAAAFGFALAVLGGMALAQQGLAFSEFRGYEDWQTVSISHSDTLCLLALILANPVMIDVYPAGIPGNPGTQHDVDFMVKDSNRFPDSGGWGYAFFKYDPATDTFTPATSADRPPQANDAKCGFVCHSIVRTRDYVFTEYGHR